MFTTDRFAQVATALTGAVILSTLSVGAAVGPVRAAEPAQSWIASVPIGTASAGDRAGA
jgi:hypothetical protein